MSTVPPPPSPLFSEQDSVRPIPNLDPSRLADEYTRLTFNYPLMTGDLFIMNLNSTVNGGTYNLSFYIAQNTNSLAFLIPTSFIKVSAGTTVELRARYMRGFTTTYAQAGLVNINRLPIVVPTPATRWDFDDGTFQGWVPQGGYVGGLLRIVNQAVALDVTNSVPGKSHIITRAVPVIAGITYDCHFGVSGDTLDTSVLYMTINGARIGPDVRNFRTGLSQIGDGAFTATTTGDVRLGIFNDAVPNGLHRFSLDFVVITPRP